MAREVSSSLHGGWSAPPAPLVRRRGGRHEEDALETEGVARLGGDDEMRDVRRVEASAQDAQARLHGRHVPSPSPARRPTART